MELFALVLIHTSFPAYLASSGFNKYFVIPGSRITKEASLTEILSINGTAECCLLCDKYPTCTAVNTYNVRNTYLMCELKKLGAGRYATSPTAGWDSYFKNLSAVNPIAYAIATQDSTRPEGGAASRAIDGITSGNWSDNSCTHTADNMPEKWWMVKFQRAFPVSAIVIWNRNDSYPGRLRDLAVYVAVHADALGSTDTLCATYTGPPSSSTDNPTQITCQTAMFGRYVKIVKSTGTQPLTLCEVEILQ